MAARARVPRARAPRAARRRADARDARASAGRAGVGAPPRRRAARRYRARRGLARAALPHEGRAARRLPLRARLRAGRRLPAHPDVERDDRESDLESVHRRRRRAVGRGHGPLLRRRRCRPRRRHPDHAVVRTLHGRFRLPLRRRADRRDGHPDGRGPHGAAAQAHARSEGDRRHRDRDLSAAPDRGRARGGLRPVVALAARRHPRLGDVVRRAAARGSSASWVSAPSTSSA